MHLLTMHESEAYTMFLITGHCIPYSSQIFDLPSPLRTVLLPTGGLAFSLLISRSPYNLYNKYTITNINLNNNNNNNNNIDNNN